MVVRETRVMPAKLRVRNNDGAALLTAVQQGSTARMLGHGLHSRTARFNSPPGAPRACARRGTSRKRGAPGQATAGDLSELGPLRA
jgi:hypothetical protein